MRKLCASILLMVIGLLSVSCSTLPSIKNTPTEELRIWKRRDTNAQNLILFIHGFSSEAEQGWGQFPDFVVSDPDLKGFDIYLYGSRTKGCSRQLPLDLKDQGKLLAEVIKHALPRYSSIILVGHSMGGLLVMQAVLESGKEINQKKIRILTFGTPYSGVEKTVEILGVKLLKSLCRNPQLEYLMPNSTERKELLDQWRSKWDAENKKPILAFWGHEDNLVSKKSACYPGFVQTCEVVDGNHYTMVKPKNQDHLGYKKLKEVAKEIQVPDGEGAQIRVVPGEKVQSIKWFSPCKQPMTIFFTTEGKPEWPQAELSLMEDNGKFEVDNKSKEKEVTKKGREIHWDKDKGKDNEGIYTPPKIECSRRLKYVGAVSTLLAVGGVTATLLAKDEAEKAVQNYQQAASTAEIIEHRQQYEKARSRYKNWEKVKWVSTSIALLVGLHIAMNGNNGQTSPPSEDHRLAFSLDTFEKDSVTFTLDFSF